MLLRRHEGLAPVRLLKARKPVRALFKAGAFLPGIGSIALSFFSWIPVPAPRAHDPGILILVDATGSLFRDEASAAARSDGNSADASHRDAIRDLKRRQPFDLLHEAGEPETETRSNKRSEACLGGLKGSA